jgi:hypothetical protein
MIKRGGLTRNQIIFIIISCILLQFVRINIHELMQVKAFENYNISTCYTIDFLNGLQNNSFYNQSDLTNYNNLSMEDKTSILYSGIKADFIFNIILLFFLFFYSDKLKDKRITERKDFVIMSIIIITLTLNLISVYLNLFSSFGVNNLLLTNQNLTYVNTCL